MAATVRIGLLLLAAFVAMSSYGAENVVCPTKPNVNCTLQIMYENKNVSCDQIPEMPVNNTPTIKWPGFPSNTSMHKYVLAILDPDVSSTCSDKDKYYLHWLVELNITSAGNVVITKTFTGGEYQPPSPPANETHRYQFHLYRCSGNFSSALPGRNISLNSIKSLLTLPETLSASFQYKYGEPKAAPTHTKDNPTHPINDPTHPIAEPNNPKSEKTQAPSQKSNRAVQHGPLLCNFLMIVLFKYFI